jgi:hypothetical protein
MQRQENTAQREDNNKSTETNPERTQMLQLAEDIKTIIITAFHMFKKLRQRDICTHCPHMWTL